MSRPVPDAPPFCSLDVQAQRAKGRRSETSFGPARLPGARGALIDLATDLLYWHAVGVVARHIGDLGMRDGRVAIADLRYALVDGLGTPTVPQSAPELAAGAGSPQTDVWVLGVWLRRHFDLGDLGLLVDRMCAEHPEDRPSLQLVLHELGAPVPDVDLPLHIVHPALRAWFATRPGANDLAGTFIADRDAAWRAVRGLPGGVAPAQALQAAGICMCRGDIPAAREWLDRVADADLELVYVARGLRALLDGRREQAARDLRLAHDLGASVWTGALGRLLEAA